MILTGHLQARDDGSYLVGDHGVYQLADGDLVTVYRPGATAPAYTGHVWFTLDGRPLDLPVTLWAKWCATGYPATVDRPDDPDVQQARREDAELLRRLARGPGSTD